ncbi:hypothetical protein M404DRAFT_148114 [Pisolithus tinctorius Marx 270]|uniref:SGTA homodimerisation domain-containing protein n=1 Tax=Pisolithus tinctorius Marx 270 TaxID=870435 RepID=A0A0C3P4N8_PISTI|nr:hypothetical protein M404DRAFT_148114 [Pisolithus tinctorius Marx 270]
MADRKQQLVLSIIDFLNKSIDDGTIKQDDREGLEVAIQCIGEAFGVDPSDDRQREQLTIKPATLQSIFEVFLKTRHKVSPSTAPSSGGPSTTKASPPSAETKKQAEAHKAKGNAHMNAKNYTAAIDAYTSAIALDPSNPGDNAAAVLDAESAIEVDPNFVKAYSRLGHAHYTLGNYRAAADAFKKGTELDPTNENLKSGLKSALDRVSDDDDSPPPLIPEDQLRPSSPSSASTRGTGGGAGTGGLPNMAGLADMFRNMGGAGGAEGGGMPDLGSMMNNPMMMQMAQQLMANGGLERMMSNPSVANMMNRVQNGGGLPSMEELMSDPTMRNL